MASICRCSSSDAGFDVETRRDQSRKSAAMGYMSEVHLLQKKR